MGQLAILAVVVHLVSPSGAVSFELDRAETGKLTYSIALDRQIVVAPSGIGIVVDGRRLGDRVDVGPTEAYAVDDTYPWLGVHASAVARCRGARVNLTDAATRTAWTIDARACDDGVGFRYVVPGDAKAER